VKNDLAGRTRDLALTLTSWPSVTGSHDEAAFAPKLAELLKPIATAWVEPIHGDPVGRSNVFAVKRGQSNRAIVLTGHFDVVPIDDFGELKHLALDAERLLPAAIERLRRTGENPKALADFESGEFLPGRGLLDMKAGLAAGIAAMESYAGDATLIFLGVSDEEDRSAGARDAVGRLKAFAHEQGLEIALVANLDAISDQGDGSFGRRVALGSIGKQLLTAFVVGQEAHACYPRDGVNAAYLAAELAAEFELAPELEEISGDEIAAAPTALALKDQKHGYNVTTPAQAWVYWNTLQHKRSAAEVMEIAVALARRAMARAAAKSGRAVPVMRFAELAARAPQVDVGAIASRADLDLPERARLATQALWQASGLAGPAAVMGFGSIPYAAVSLADAALEAKIVAACAGLGVKPLRYFPGISDASFYGEGMGDHAATAANSPTWGQAFEMPAPGNLPTINIGPWGRDYHHWLERLNAPYAFETLPKVLLAVIEAVAGRR
jgi:arginine utilization protein RocB